MKVGEIAKFLLQPEVAYGKLGFPPRDIPPNAKVVFTVELLESNLIGENRNIFEMSQEERQEQPFCEILKAAESLKDDGNRLYKKTDYQGAVELYSQAVEILESYVLIDQDAISNRDTLLYTLMYNIGYSHLHLKKYKAAVKASERALSFSIKSGNYKPYHCMANAYLEDGKTNDAKIILEKGLKVFFRNYMLTQLYEKVLLRQAKENKEVDSVMKTIAKRMFLTD